MEFWGAYSECIHAQAQRLPSFDEAEGLDVLDRYPYGARSLAGVYVGDLLRQEVPALSSDAGNVDIVAIARRPGVLSKVAIRTRPGAPEPIVLGLGADHVARVRQGLDGERIHVVAWQRSPSAYIADALGLGHVPPMLLVPGIEHARVLLGEIDLRGIGGWRGLNSVLASSLTGWRIRLEPVAATLAWRRLQTAMLARRPVFGTLIGRTERGVRVEVLGLDAVLSGARGRQRLDDEIEVRITRMDADEGRIFVSDRLPTTGQLVLPFA